MTNSALLLVDLQNDFMPNGALGVAHGDEVIAVANKLMDSNAFNMIIASQDWHPQNHFSFQSLWPVHCVQNTKGAELVSQLKKDKINKIIYKGTNPDIDSYSAFFDNDHLSQTELDETLKKNKIKKIFVMGLATDYCVKFTVLDAIKLGFEVFVIHDGCRGIDLKPGDVQNAWKEMEKAGAKIIRSENVGK